MTDGAQDENELKLVQKTDVVFVKKPDVRYSVFNHRYPLYTYAKSKTGEFL